MLCRGSRAGIILFAVVACVLGGVHPASAQATETPTPSPSATPEVEPELPQRPLSLTSAGYRIRRSCDGVAEVVAGRTVRFVVAQGAPAVAVTFSLLKAGSRTPIASRTVAAAAQSSWSVRLPNLGRFAVIAQTQADERFAATRRTQVIDVVWPRWTRSASGVRLAVPYYRQQYRLSCEAAVLRMGHNYHRPGRLTSDAQVQRIFGVDPRRPAIDGGCDPDRAFCGNVAGLMFRDGYGIHAGPVASAATRLSPCRPSLRIVGFGSVGLARYLNEGYPILLWGAHPGARSGVHPVRWRAWTGRVVTAWNVEHTWAVVGFQGSVSNPSAFYVFDPKQGTKTVSAAALMSFSRPFRTAVVVRG